METSQGIFLYSCLHLKLAKTLFFFLSFMFFLQQIGEQDSGTGSAWRGGERRSGPSNVYTCKNNCENDKIKLKK
jgi:hypothetical protein